MATLKIKNALGEFVNIVALKGDKGDTGPQGIQGPKGDKGDKPAHRWIDTSLQIENPDGTWGDAVNLKGESGDGSGNMHTSIYDTTGKNTDIFNYVDTGLSGKVDNARVLTDVPANAKFTDKRTARFVVGTSTAGWTAADCDYLCDGTADQTEINAAITALPETGGEIVILDGTYNIAARINVNKNNVSIRGNGNATILKRMFNSYSNEGVITLISRSGCKIANLQIEGNKTSYTNTNNCCIYLHSSNNNTITGNTCNNSKYSGIHLADASNENTITGNTCNNNSNGIYLEYTSNNNTVTGNACNNNGSGIFLDYVNNNTVTGNTCNNNDYGIYLESTSNNTITSNTCIRGTGLETDYTTSQHTIQLYGTGNKYNLVAMNNCMGKAVTNGGGTGNTLVNNKFDET
jgi:parallel beta-helix repeat protein